jgi:pimeloyl-ACP methyl ester carboxylesterase
MKTELRARTKQHCSDAMGLENQTTAGISAPIALGRPSWLSPTAWPFETSAINIDGHNVAFTDVGRGSVLLFVHTGFWSFIWRDVIQRLAPDFRCVCFDAPGTGRSDRVPAGEISLERAATALVALVRTLDLHDTTLVFHDLGGPSGIAGAAKLAERFRGLCAINTFAWRPSGLPFRFLLGLMGSAAMCEFDALTGILPRITGSAFGIGRRLDKQSRESFLAGIGPQGVRSFHSYMRDAAKSKTIYSHLEKALDGPFRRLPLLTIFGERNDPLGFQPRWRNLFPDAQQVVVSGGNHFPMCDDPALVASSIRAWHRERVRPLMKVGQRDAGR